MSKKSGESQNSQILAWLIELNKPLEDVVVKISPILKKIESSLFLPSANFKEIDYKMLFLGAPSKKLKGLFYICSLKGRGFTNKPKKGAIYAIQIIKRLLYESPQKDVVLSVFLDLENEELKILRLGFHIISDEKNMNAFYICKINYEKRKYLNSENYIENSQSQKKFLKWIQEQNDDNKSGNKFGDDQSERSTADGDGPMQMFQMIYRRKKSDDEQSRFNIIRNKEYFLNTFKDPLTARKGNEKSKNNPLSNKTRTEEKSFLDDDDDNQKNEDIIENIHIESDEFDPVILLDTIHQKTPRLILTQSVKLIDLDISTQLSRKEKLFYSNINDISQQEIKLKSLNEILFSQEAESNIGITSQIKKKLAELNFSIHEITKPFHEINFTKIQIKTCLKILKKQREFLNWPKKMESYIIKGDFKALIQEYQRKNILLDAIKDYPIFEEISESILLMIEEFHNTLLNNLSIREDKNVSLKETITHLFITNYPKPIDITLDKYLKESKDYIMRYFNPTFTFEIEEKNSSLDFFERRLSLNSLRDLVSKLNSDEDFTYSTSEEQIYKLNDEPSTFSASTSSQIRNFDRFIKIIFRILENYFELEESIKKGEFRKFLKLSAKQLQKYDETAINRCEADYDTILKLLIGNIRSFVNKNAALTSNSYLISSKIIQSDLYTIDKMLLMKQIKRKDVKDLLSRIIELYFNHSQRYILKEVIERIDYEHNTALSQDFDGFCYSKFFKKIQNGFDENINEIRLIKVIMQRETEKSEILVDYLSNIFQDFLTEMKQRLFIDSKREEYPMILMIILANINYMADVFSLSMGEAFCDEMQVINKAKFIEQLETSNRFFFYSQAKEMKLLYVRRRKMDINEIIDTYLISDVKYDGKASKFERKFIEYYKQGILIDSDSPTIRFYILEILSLLIVVYEEILHQVKKSLSEIMKLVIDEISNSLFLACQQIIMQTSNVLELQQIWHEIEFLMNLTTKYQSVRCETNFKNIYDELKARRSEIENTPLHKTELFNEEETNRHSILIITMKLKFFRQYQVLFD